MIDRKIKAVWTLLLGVMALAYMIQNVINLEQAYGAFIYVTGLTDHTVYPNNLLPELASPLTHVAAWIVFVGEAAAGLVLIYASYKLWKSRSGGAEFEAARSLAKIGCAIAITVWFGFFTVFGGAGYQMWQTEMGSGSLADAFTFWVFAFLLLLYLNQPERDQQDEG